MIASYLAWTTLVALPISLVASQSAPPAAVNEANSRITLDVVANDKSGKPVSDLQQQEFTILDNKQPQKILSFQAVRQVTPSDSGLEVVLVIDSVNTAFTRVSYEREQVEKFLKQDAGRLSWPVSFAFLSDSGLSIQGSPSRDGNTLVSYLNGNETALRTIRRSQGFYGAVDRSQLSLRAAGQLAEYEAKRPGRKIVVWISPGWPLLSGPNVQLSSKDQQGIFNTIVAVSTQLRQARIALYSIDPLGTADAGGLRTFYYEEFLKGVSSPGKAQFGNLALQVLAQQSGGRVLNSSNDVAGEIERSVRDANAYYVLSFDPVAADGPNEYHAIDVKIAQSQIKAQTRAGYYAQPAQSRMQ